MNRIKSVNRVFLATVLISIIGSYVNNKVFEYTENYFYVLLLSQFILIIPSLVYIKVSKINIAKAIRFRKIKASNIILIIVFSYLITPLMNLINAFSMMYVQNTTADFMSNIIANNSLLLTLFMVAFIPSVMEETVYRGVFYNEYSKINPLKGIILSGFLFGIIHGNLNQFSYAFAMGIIFALLIEATGSILSTMIVHFCINGTSVLLMALYPKLLRLLQQIYGVENFNAEDMINSMSTDVAFTMDFRVIIQTYGFTALFTTLLAYIVFRTIAKNSGRWENIKSIFSKGSETKQIVNIREREYGDVNQYEETNHKKSLITVSLVIGIIICVALMIASEF